MDLTPREKRVVRRAVQAYHEKKECKGRYTGRTADQIIEELKPSPARWTHLAALVIATVEEGKDAEVLATDPRLR
ncbi:MAG TPA: hypothetical protein EYO83_01730 [Gemmatimonadetes bacterium]|jgi:hypothetical protein|nr:hypothetical protein [Gemmatimonadota bacterium]